MVTMEELLCDSNGRLVTNSAASYKIPNINTVPKKFRVAILKDGICRGNIYSSKVNGFFGFFKVFLCGTSVQYVPNYCSLGNW